jgi:hypothetical protein
MSVFDFSEGEMVQLDSLLKLFGMIKTPKGACAAVLFAVYGALIWRPWMETMGRLGGEERILCFSLTAIGIFGVAVLTAEALFRAYGRLQQAMGWCLQEATAALRRRQSAKHVASVLPALPKEHITLLKRLSGNDLELSRSDNDITELTRQRLIQEVHQVHGLRYIYRLNPEIRSVVEKYLAKERHAHVTSRLSRLSDEERHFLSLFFSKTVGEGTPESGVMMENGTFRAGTMLAADGILEYSPSRDHRADRFSLPFDSEKLLEASVFGTGTTRTELLLDPAWIRGTGASGSGAGSSYH